MGAAYGRRAADGPSERGSPLRFRRWKRPVAPGRCRPDLRIRSQRAGADAGYAPIVTGDPGAVARLMEE